MAVDVRCPVPGCNKLLHRIERPANGHLVECKCRCGAVFHVLVVTQSPAAFDRLPGESDKAYAAFRAYLRHEPAVRSQQIVALECSKHVSQVNRWANRWAWRARAAAWDSYQTRRAPAYTEGA
jgi:hypothetical protein